MRARIQEFFQGGSRPENSLDNLFFSVLNLFYRGGPVVLLQRKLYFSKDPEGVQHFLGGPTFSKGGGGGGPNANFYRNPYNL